MNDESLARRMIYELSQQNVCGIELKRKERAEYMAIKKKEVEVHEYKARQKDLKFYMRPYEHLTREAHRVTDKVRAGIKAMWGLDFLSTYFI